MRATAVLVCAIVLAGCSHDSPPASTPDAGTLLSCPATEKPIGTSALATTPQVFHPSGPFQVGQVVSFDVPANTASITIVEQAVSAPDSITFRTSTRQATLDNTAVPLLVKDPNGNTIYDDNQPPPAGGDVSTLPVFFASDSPATGTLTIPNTTAGLTLVASGLPPSDATHKWSFIVSDFAYECTSPAASPLPAGTTCTAGDDQSLYDVTVITKPMVGGAIPTSGTLDVSIYFATTNAGGAAGSAPLDAVIANQGTDTDLNRMVTSLGQLFAQANVTIGSVKYTPLPDVLATYATGVDIDQSGACGPLSQLLKFAAPGNTLNIFFVSSFRASGLPSGQSIVGIDGTIPGPSTIGGTVASGAAVSTLNIRAGTGTAACTGPFNLNCGADETAYIIAHEAGHFLGLYHVTEAEGTLFDPLADTATCACSACAPLASRSRCADASPTPVNAYQMKVTDCSQVSTTCGEGTNLMFWQLGATSAGTLTLEQQSVLRANPLIQNVP